MQICQLRSYLESKYYTELDELCEIINGDKEPEVPPLETDIPLSYRTNSTNNYYPLISPTVGTTATVIEGYIQKDSFTEEQVGYVT